MKIKIETEELTIRLKKEDFAQLAEKGIIESHIQFVNKPLFVYFELVEIPEIDVDFTEEGIQVYFPQGLFEQWQESDRVGYKSHVQSTKVFVEKDLPRRSQKIHGAVES
jgi:hypothetical protein